MIYREKFLNDLKCSLVIKDSGTTFADLARLYGYPEENGANLCKKDYYKFIKACEDAKAINSEERYITNHIEELYYNSLVEENNTTMASNKKPVDSEIENLVLKSKWEVQTKGGGKDVLKSYRNDVTPLQIKKFREDLINDLRDYSPVKSFTVNKSIDYNKNMLLISLPDYHIGRRALSMDIVDEYIGVINKIIYRSDIDNIDRIVYVIGNDFFNSDSNYSTTRGTPQFDYNEWQETWNFGKNLLLHSIEYLKEFGKPVDIINVPGNHDSNKIFYLGDVLEAYYRNDEQITIDNSTNLFKKYVYGNTLLMFEHGEMKDTDYPLIMASEFPREWGECEHRVTMCGHLHHTIVKEYRGNVTVKFLPSLATNSEWEKSKGYKTSPKAEGNIFSKTEGLIYTVNVKR